MPTSITLEVLHDIIQITMGWSGQHLWEFKIDGRTYGLSMDDVRGAAPPNGDDQGPPARNRHGSRNDGRISRRFGDSWAHRIVVTRIRPGDPDISYPHCPPEDCGGVPGYRRMLDALADPKHPDHADIADDRQDWDPREIDELPLRIALGRPANRRNAARTRIATTTSRCGNAVVRPIRSPHRIQPLHPAQPVANKHLSVTPNPDRPHAFQVSNA